MSDNTYKEIVDKLKKEQGFEILIDSANEDEKYLFRCCNGDIKKYKELINKALDEWESKKEEKDNDFELGHMYRRCLGNQIFPFLILLSSLLLKILIDSLLSLNLLWVSSTISLLSFSSIIISLK